MTDSFNTALAEYGLINCVANDTTLWVGADGSRDWPNARRIGPDLSPRRRIEFLAAPVQTDLIRAFAMGNQAQTVEEIFIGTSQWYVKGYDRAAFPGFDMATAVTALRGATLPSLRSLVLGDMEDLSGGLRSFGTIGNITPIFSAAPALTYLGLHGHFTLDAPVRHDTLTTLEAQFDNSGITGDPIEQETFDNLLTSSFPNLDLLSLELTDGGDDDTLTLPEAFFAASQFPALSQIGLDRLGPASAARLANHLQSRGIASLT